MAAPFAVFGPGVVMITRTDTTTPISVNVGFSQELTLNLAGTEKLLYGQNQYPLVATRGTVKATGKIKAATISGLAWNALFFGNSFTVGRDNYYLNEMHNVATTTVTMTNVTGGIIDLGVTYSSTGIPLIRVASAPAVGQYSVNVGTGVYTINVGDENIPLLYNYSNFSAVATGQQLNVTNQALGTNPTFQLDYWTNLNQPAAAPFAVRLFACVGTKLAFAAKLEDYAMPEFDFSMFALASGAVMNFNFPQLS